MSEEVRTHLMVPVGSCLYFELPLTDQIRRVEEELLLFFASLLDSGNAEDSLVDFAQLLDEDVDGCNIGLAVHR
jgi:hypothetical protein